MARSSALSGVFSALARLTIIVAAGSLCAMVLVLAWQVIGRYVLNASPGWTEPVALVLVSVSALFGAAIAVRNESHFNFPTFVEGAPTAVRGALKFLSRLLTLASGLALAWYGGFLMLDSWSVPMAGAPAPEGLSYIGVAVGGALIAIFALERLLAGDPAKEHA